MIKAKACALTASAVALLCASGAATADVLTLQSTNEEEVGFFGVAVSGIPDINGDGVDDVIVGASTEDGGGVTDAGRVYIFSGVNGALIRAHSSPNDTNGGRFGIAVAGIKDLSGDGRGDYAVGARGELVSAGRVYVYSGNTGNLLRTHTSPNSENGGRFGDAVAAIDDLTGDGRGDYIIGAPNEDSSRGRAYIYNGSTGALVRTHNSPNAEQGGQFGIAVAGVPDTNADNRGDYVVGAPYEDPGAAPSEAGRAYVYSGINGALRFTLASPTQQSGGRFGWSVGGVPDAGGNGSGDIIVGAPYEDFSVDGNTLFDAGRAHLFSGTTGNLGHTYQESDADAGSEDFFGWSVDGLDDRTGDGLGDVIISSVGLPYRVYVFRGTGDFAQLEVISTPDPIGVNQIFGNQVARVRDANGDGKGDFIIGAPGSDDFPTGPSQAGRAYLHRTALTNNGCNIFSVEPLVVGPNSVTNIGATGGGSGATQCLLNLEADVWHYHTATCDGTVTFSTCNSAQFDTVLAVYAGCSYGTPPLISCNLGSGPLECNDDTTGCNFGSVVSVPCSVGQCFFVRIGGFQGDQGIATLTVTCSCPGDLNGDGQVNGGDLALLLGNWNNPGVGDLNGNGIVNGADLAILLGNWGPC